MAPLALEMVRDIDEDTVDFQPNYDGRSQEPTCCRRASPTCWSTARPASRSGMATNIPPHNLREVADGAQWALEHPDATRRSSRTRSSSGSRDPDFPNGALIVGRQGIEQAYRTGRGSVTQRAVIEIDEDTRGRTCLVITELPYMVNPDNLALKIAELADSGKVQGIADVRDDTSDRTGQRLVVVLKRDASRGWCSTTCSSTPSCRPTSRQHARAGRRRAAHAVDRPVHQQLGRPPDRGHPAAHALPPARGRGAGPHLRGWSRHSTRSTR
jgi:DNA gyrase subunit A